MGLDGDLLGSDWKKSALGGAVGVCLAGVLCAACREPGSMEPDDPDADDEAGIAPDPWDALSGWDVLPDTREGVTYRMFSSYDRLGGNDDGVEGTWSCLRIDEGECVLADMEGPGVITRIWFALPETDEELAAIESRHVRVRIGGALVLDLPFEQMFGGTVDAFPFPLTGQGLGGAWSYTPIPFDDSCTVSIDGGGAQFYQVTWAERADVAEAFSLDVAAARVAGAAASWSDSFGETAVALPTAVPLEVGERLELMGPGRIVALTMDTGLAVPHGRLRIWWEGNSRPAVDVPLDLMFGRPEGSVPGSSLLAGLSGTTSYLAIPMPFQERATIEVLDGAPGTIVVHWEPGPTSGRYLHARYQESASTVPGRHHVILRTYGPGHLVGTVLDTTGSTAPVWLEGDERVRVDGNLVAHGTGTEDYFNSGWWGVQGRLDEARWYPSHGFPTWTRTGTDRHVAAYRWHLADPITWTDGVRFDIEHGGDNQADASYRSVAFFYHLSPSAP